MPSFYRSWQRDEFCKFLKNNSAPYKTLACNAAMFKFFNSIEEILIVSPLSFTTEVQCSILNAGCGRWNPIYSIGMSEDPKFSRHIFKSILRTYRNKIFCRSL